MTNELDRPGTDYLPTIPALLRRAAREFGDHDFMVMADRRLTYAEAELTSRRVAMQLVRAGVGKGSRVGAVFPSNIDWVIAWLATTRIGALFIPFPSTMKPPELRSALRYTDVQMLITPPEILDTDMYGFLERAVPELTDARGGPYYFDELPYLRDVRVTEAPQRAWAIELDLEPGSATESGDALPDDLIEQIEEEVTPSDFMIGILTSGSTAAPKCVVHTHGAEIRHGANMARNFSEGTSRGDRRYSALPFFWIGGLTVVLLPTMHAGATILCHDRFEVEAAMDLMEQEDATHAMGWTPMIAAIAQHPTFPERNLAHVRGLLPTGDPPYEREYRHQSLGMSETSGPHTACPPGEVTRVLPDELRGSFGAPMPHVHHRIVDPDTHVDLPAGETGELLVRGYSVMDNIYKRERHEVFTEDGWYATGDSGHFCDGYLIFEGRLNDMIKTAGANVAPGEVERVILATGDVDLTFVFGIPDAERGQLVVAVVVPLPDTEIDVDKLTAHLREQMASYKVPRRIILLSRDEIPWMGTGKPDRGALIDRVTSAHVSD